MDPETALARKVEDDLSFDDLTFGDDNAGAENPTEEARHSSPLSSPNSPVITMGHLHSVDESSPLSGSVGLNNSVIRASSLTCAATAGFGNVVNRTQPSYSVGMAQSLTEDVQSPLLKRRMSRKDKFARKGSSGVVSEGKLEKLEMHMALVGGVVNQDPSAVEEIFNAAAPVKSCFFKPGQSFGYVQFHDADGLNAAIEQFKEDVTFKVTKCVLLPPNSIIPGQDAPNPEVRNATLVLKNLSFQLKQEKLQDTLNNLDVKPQSVNFHYDASGAFRGMAFAKYKTVDESARAYELLNGLEIDKRRVRVEYKKKNSKSNSVDLDRQDDEAKLLFEQLKEFRDSANSTGSSSGDTEVEPPSVVFPPTLSSFQRKRIHSISEKLGLLHQTADTRFITVKAKPESQMPQGSSTRTNSIPILPRKQTLAPSGGSRPRSYTSPKHSFEPKTFSPPRMNSAVNSVSPLPPSHMLPQSLPTNSISIRERAASYSRTGGSSLTTQGALVPRGPDGTKGFSAGRGRGLPPPALPPTGNRSPSLR
eukprot:GFYU01019545.1.p1 GENE.GFYU01019545.1~~GFYU01019545.1.p1  ORF type:complete len:533 (-),score=105.94 GFYU01019545.1:87-1685(-)